MCRLVKEIYLEQAIANCEPQLHRSKWLQVEDDVLLELISYSIPLEDIQKVISLRSVSAIYTRANHYGFGYKMNNEDNKVYFHKGINHKTRRTKKEILAELEKVPIKSAKSVEDYDEKPAVGIPEKMIDVSISDIDEAMQILIKTKEEKMEKTMRSIMDKKITDELLEQIQCNMTRRLLAGKTVMEAFEMLINWAEATEGTLEDLGVSIDRNESNNYKEILNAIDSRNEDIWTVAAVIKSEITGEPFFPRIEC